jgi:hypothetical protein
MLHSTQLRNLYTRRVIPTVRLQNIAAQKPTSHQHYLLCILNKKCTIRLENLPLGIILVPRLSFKHSIDATSFRQKVTQQSLLVACYKSNLQIQRQIRMAYWLFIFSFLTVSLYLRGRSVIILESLLTSGRKLHKM